MLLQIRAQLLLLFIKPNQTIEQIRCCLKSEAFAAVVLLDLNLHQCKCY